MYPWVKDGKHPFASVATPRRHSHPVRQYDEPVISVVIPVGPGHEDEVRRALDSLEMQHFHKWEAVVVFDTGNEYYPDLMTAYPYIRPIFTDKKGAGYARNRGVEAARGGLIFFLDADDSLVDADAFTKILATWSETGEIIYTDYLGKAIWSEEEAVKEFGDNLLGYNPKTGATVFKKQAVDFDCGLAQRQPLHNPYSLSMPYYHWCLVSVLIPKAWHCGFDESLSTWEDVAYFWELARRGHCFYRLAEPLVMYNYHKGTRREQSVVNDESSRQMHRDMIKYISSRLEGITLVGCNCGKRQEAKQVSVKGDSMADNELIEVIFNIPGGGRDNYGRGLKSPTGKKHPNGQLYDYHGYNLRHGDRILVHIDDQRARPDMFKPVQPEVKPPVIETKPLDAPVLIDNKERFKDDPNYRTAKRGKKPLPK
jgi:glycosyltransferase involved in cell wall biosynthesis